jgi:hypothetical protein
VPGHNRAHYRGSYDRRARALVAAANADSETVCWRCGRKARSGDPWQAGHVRDGDPTSPLRPEHRSCNASAGAKLRVDGFKTSRDW